MNIKIVHTRYPHWGKYSGINQFVKYIDPVKYKVQMQIVSDSDEDFPIQNKVIRDRIRQLVQKKPMSWYKLSDLTAEFKLFRQCWLNKLDIIHYLDGEHSAKFLPSLMRKLNKRRPKFIATYHQCPEELDSLIIKDVITCLDCITVVSPEQIAFFKEFVASDKIRVILHGIDIDYFKIGNIPKEDGKFKCITVGHWLRDFKTICKVANMLKDNASIEFHIVSSHASEVENLANVIIHRNISDTELLKLYQQSHILFLPLIKTTANNALLEGIACGLPIVTGSLPSVRAYLPGNEGIFIKKNDPQQFADAILYLFHNTDERRKMSREARKRAEEFDWRKITPQYEAIYSELIYNQ